MQGAGKWAALTSLSACCMGTKAGSSELKRALASSTGMYLQVTVLLSQLPASRRLQGPFKAAAEVRPALRGTVSLQQ